eukprot:COSAG01_NODE_160_length_23692_cov_9.703599_24_plen_44_part_00
MALDVELVCTRLEELAPRLRTAPRRPCFMIRAEAVTEIPLRFC